MIVEIYDDTSGQIKHINLLGEEFQPLLALTDDLDLYFTHEGATRVPTSALIPTRARPKGVRNANALMLKASQGEIPLRKPIAISSARVKGRRLIISGNATYLNAIFSGWTSVYAVDA
jgi:hypothetical protein